MTLRAILQRAARSAARVPLLRRAVIGYYESRSPEAAWNREHPFDVENGVRTSGMVPPHVLAPGGTAYGAAQPSIIRGALALVPNPGTCQFVDLGCGKGRPLFVATEFGFPSVIGVEFSPTLADIGRRNAKLFARAHPDRTKVEIVTGDAIAYPLPTDNLVVFLYNPFGRQVMSALLRNIERSLRAAPRDFYLVYYNPVSADVFDASGVLERRHAAQFRYDASEIGFGPDESDAVVIWQNRGNPNPRPAGNFDLPVTIVAPEVRAEIVMA